MRILKKILGGGRKDADRGWTGKSRSPLRKARIEHEDDYERQIICNNGACPGVSFFVKKTQTSGRCERCGTRWRV
ncbi:hypothetical protein AB0K60_02140 [Thermopolyspora sp. NPDC052614]|uniref:hypothetical protein n=1 Tax=Thermopolyspora sp. NPDC052614 TaxID=3155682 RepID=UPI0034194EDB